MMEEEEALDVFSGPDGGVQKNYRLPSSVSPTFQKGCVCVPFFFRLGNGTRKLEYPLLS